MIDVSAITKTYRVARRSHTGLLHSVRSLFAPDYVQVKALDDVSWRVNRGEIHALIGRNGSGKSTLIKILSGILYPNSGSAMVGGVVPWQSRRQYVRSIGVVFGQKSQLTWELPAIDSFELQRCLYQVPEAQFRETLDYLVHAFAAVTTRPVRSLSLGERMKCEIMCALLHRPRVLFLDEPTIGLDLISKDQVRHAIRAVNAELGTTIVLTSHDLSDVSSLCRNISLIDSGRFLYHGDIESLLLGHATHKRVEVKLRRPVSAHELSAFSLVSTGEFSAAVELPSSEAGLPEVLPRLLRELPIADVTVESMPLEQVVKSFYRNSGAATPNG